MNDEQPPVSADYPFAPHYLNVLGSRMHYIDEGTGNPILLLHGNPTWSYLWRNIIPHLSRIGRVIAPDLIGMGRSGKPDIEYRFFDHVRYLESFIEALNLSNLSLVLHDWGSALGFHYAMRHQQNVNAIAFMEANVRPRYSWDEFDPPMRQTFSDLRTPGLGWDMAVNQNIFIEGMLPGATLRKLSEREMNFYREPFLDPPSRKPLWRWPNELPIAGEPADVFNAVKEYSRQLCHSTLPKLLLFVSPGGIIDAGQVAWCREHLPNLKSVYLGKGYHFIQEDYPQRIGEEIAAWLESLTTAFRAP
jgi:haloalkane dehalogenase